MICVLGDNEEPKVTTKDINTQLWFCDLCQVLQSLPAPLPVELKAPILANKPLPVLRKALSLGLKTN